MPILNDFLEETERGVRVRSLCIDAIDLLARMPDSITRAVEYLPRSAHPWADHARQRTMAVDLVGNAHLEVHRQYATITGQAVMTTWGALERYVDRLLKELWLHDASLREIPDVKAYLDKLEENGLDADTEWTRVSKRILSKANTKEGIERFENIFKKLGLSDHSHTQIHTTLLEFSEIRHCIVHRGGIADPKLVMRCPHLRFQPGEIIAPNPLEIARYDDAVRSYASFITFRVAKHLGEPGAEDAIAQFEKEHGASEAEVLRVMQTLRRQQEEG